MTQDDFIKTGFTSNMKCRYSGQVMVIMSIDFEEMLFRVTDPNSDDPNDDGNWVRCENIQLIDSNRLQ